MEKQRSVCRETTLQQKQGIAQSGQEMGQCPYCGVAILSSYEICPQCGHALQSDHCSFCGERMDEDDLFCGECGNPRSGIVCPACGTLNFRSFCRQCNRALNDLGQAEMEHAQADPLFVEMVELGEQLAEMEVALTHPSTETPQQPMPTPQPAAPRRSKLQITLPTLPQEELEEEYHERVEEMQDLLHKLRPDEEQKPQMQRNYYSARKLPTMKYTVTKVPVRWICNLCHAEHNNPSECAQPELGGEWIYEEIVTGKRVFDYEE
jgi:hypothetical protein